MPVIAIIRVVRRRIHHRQYRAGFHIQHHCRCRSRTIIRHRLFHGTKSDRL
ncbi:Uncharacterised protein [Vibrio cholerae]|nr:Uncharacterised protein [Vibrio cholerae]